MCFYKKKYPKSINHLDEKKKIFGKIDNALTILPNAIKTKFQSTFVLFILFITEMLLILIHLNRKKTLFYLRFFTQKHIFCLQFK